MKNIVNSFKELGDIYKLEGEWLKKHWKGFTIFMVAYTVVCALPMILQYREEKKAIDEARRGIEQAKESIRKWQVVTDKDMKDAWKREISE